MTVTTSALAYSPGITVGQHRYKHYDSYDKQVLRTYPGNHENSVEERPMSAIFVVLPKVIISWTQPAGLTYVPCGPLIDITITSSLWQILVLHSEQTKNEYFWRILNSHRSRCIEEFIVNNWHLWLSSRGRLAATQYENSHGFRGAWLVCNSPSVALFEHQFFRCILILSIKRWGSYNW